MDHDQLRQWSKRATKHSADRPRDDRGGPRQRPQHGGVAAAKRLALGLVLIPLPLLAEPWPAAQSPYVNDYAAVIEDAAEARIVTALTDLRAQTGIEATVLTLPTRQGYTPAPDIDTFATGLFNVWGIGDATRNDGILILVLTEDRDMRIALGAGYNPEYDIPAQDIINAVMLPAFRDGRYSQGIEAGTGEVVNRIARRHAGLDPVALPEAAGANWSRFLPPALFALFAGFVVFRRRIGALWERAQPCPDCARRELVVSDTVLTPATPGVPGRAEHVTRCPQCGWTRRSEREITPPRGGAGGSGGDFGGGRSSGGGASGKW